MAVDEAILSLYPSRKTPTLRIYGWEPAFISIGYNQKAKKVLNRESRVPFVRRITGGASIFHHREVTYSIICSCTDLNISSKVKESYKQLCTFIIDFYSHLGLKAFFAGDIAFESLSAYGSFCFTAREQYDIIVKGKKIGGNAQRRRKGLILQQGSIPQEIDFESVRKNINIGFDLKGKTCGLDDLLARKTDFQSLSRLLAESFASIFGVEFESPGFYPEEIKLCSDLVNDKYNTARWNLKDEKASLA